MASYTETELIISNAAKEIKDGDIVAIGQGIPMAAGVLAKSTHAPNCIILTEAGLVGIKPFRNPLHIADPNCTRGYMYSCDLIDIFSTIANRHLIDVAFLGVGQIDRFGNINSTVIGEYKNFKMRLMGAGGAPELMSSARRVIMTMRGGRFVEKVDYVSSPGYLEGHGARLRAGFPPESGPKAVYGTKGVFRFDEESGEIYLDALFPGETVESVQADVPWKLKVAEEPRELLSPTQEEVDIIREFAPEVSGGRSIEIELGLAHLLKTLYGIVPEG
jgi:glutaconate CoA-transferase subunit B